MEPRFQRGGRVKQKLSQISRLLRQARSTGGLNLAWILRGVHVYVVERKYIVTLLPTEERSILHCV